MNNKRLETSIQYQFTNVRLFNEIFYNWAKFNEILKSGPENMKDYLFSEWNKLASELKKIDKITIKDINKNITRDDFNITFNITDNNIFVFYFSFPNYQYKDAASKYVALALTPNIPRYFTLEYSENIFQEKEVWVVGEFYLENNKRSHKNYGQVDNERLSYFSGFIQNLLESDSKV